MPASLVWLLLWAVVSALGASMPKSPKVVGPPALSITNPALLGYAPVTRQDKDKPLYDLLCFTDGRKAIATNHWWVPATRPPSSIGKNYLVQLPYIYNLVGSGMEVYYPWVKGMGNIVQNMLNEFGASWVVSAADSSSYCVSNADELTATFSWGDSMRSTIVRGSPYVTAEYKNAEVKLNTGIGIKSVTADGAEAECNGAPLTGQTFTVRMQGDEEWMVFTPPNTPLVCGSAGLSISDFTGTVRLALSDNCTTGKGAGPASQCGPGGVSQVGEWKEALVKGSAQCVDGAQVSSDASLTGITTTIAWQTRRCWAAAPEGPLMMTALPHHVPLFDRSTTVVSGGGHRNTRGHMRGVLTAGAKWVLTTPQEKIDWLAAPDSDKIPTILQALKGMGEASDMNYDLNQWAAQGMIDPYNAGKLIAKQATLVQIADVLKQKTVKDTMLARVTEHLSLWLDQRSKNRLVYDGTWGGVISCGCTYTWNELKKFAYCANNGTRLECPTLQDSGYDFGNSVYNDHHFHYGYFIYSAAVVAKFNPKWAKAYNEKVLALVRDIANPSAADPYFTTYRMFDWFVGHSWALGITPDANGRNQESSSEAVNAWYGMYLYGQATKNPQLKTLGNALLLMEAHSTNYYWHVKASNGIYPPEYEHNIVGIVHEMLVEFQTFFGLRGFFVHGIQLIPISPMVRVMFQPDWVGGAYRMFKDYCTGDPECLDSGFITFLYAEQALVDKEGAWSSALSLPNSVFSDECPGGNGNSRTALLHFIATYGLKSAQSSRLEAEVGGPSGHFSALLVVSVLLTGILAAGVAVNVIAGRLFPREEDTSCVGLLPVDAEFDRPQSVVTGYGTR